MSHVRVHRRTSLHWRAGTVVAAALVTAGGVISGGPAASAPSSGITPPIAADAPFTAKVTALVKALTVTEKVSLVHGTRPIPDEGNLGQAGYTAGVPRLGIPPRLDADALGINVFTQTTAPPTKLAIASSFDREAAGHLGTLEGVEGRAVGIDMLYGPQLDIARIPGASRNQTTAGEDPFLIGDLGVSEERAIQSEGLMSEPKHFALYNQSTNTGGGGAMLNVNADEQTRHEIYFRPFEDAVTRGGVAALMCSYNKSLGQYSCEQPVLLQDVLRGKWDFRGFVLSDYGATHSLSILQGLDTSFPSGDPYFTTDLTAVVTPSSPTYNPSMAQALDVAVARILYQYERFGLLNCASPTGPVAGCSLPPRPKLDAEAGQATALDLAQKSAVLLKNDGATLPLDTNAYPDAGSVAVIGPTARQLYVGVGGERSRGFTARDLISPLSVLQNRFRPGAVTYAPGIDWLGDVVPASALPGGLTRTDTAGGSQVDTTLDYTGARTLEPGRTYTWTGTLAVPTTDTYNLQLQRTATDPNKANPTGVGTVTLTVDGTAQTLNNPVFSGPVPILLTPDGLFNAGAPVPLTAGSHQITITYTVPTSIAAPLPVAGPVGPVNLRFTWSAVSSTISAAAAAAKNAKVAIVFANDTPGGNSTPDRDPATLQAGQDELVAAVAAANPNTVVVLNTANPVVMPWVKDVKSVLEMWLSGQEGGTATANLLTGRAVPRGKLPITFPASGSDTPVAGRPERFPGIDIHGQAATSGPTNEVYTEGIQVGYRWYDAQKIAPLFEFGRGLSYTTFAYSNLRVQRTNAGGLTVRVRITNTGGRTGTEVPQVYVGRPSRVPPGVQTVPQTLAGFRPVTLAPRQAAIVTIDVTPRELSYWSTREGHWVLGTGERSVLVGSSSRDIRLEGSLNVRG
jgi:beta-glucosidase